VSKTNDKIYRTNAGNFYFYLVVVFNWGEKIKRETYLRGKIFLKMKLHCNNCNHSTNHKILMETKEREIIKEPYDLKILELWLDIKLQALKCESCDEISFRKASIWCEDINPDTLGNPNIPHPNSFKNVPSNIVGLYTEIIESYNNEIYTLCAAGLRAIIEGICEERGVKKGKYEYKDSTGKVIQKMTKNLQGKINGLYEKGLITKAHSNILHEQRILGNEALHQLEQPSKEELINAIQIINLTMDNIYNLKLKYQDLYLHTKYLLF